MIIVWKQIPWPLCLSVALRSRFAIHTSFGCAQFAPLLILCVLKIDPSVKRQYKCSAEVSHPNIRVVSRESKEKTRKRFFFVLRRLSNIKFHGQFFKEFALCSIMFISYFEHNKARHHRVPCSLLLLIPKKQLVNWRFQKY